MEHEVETQLISIDEASEILNISHWTARYWIRMKKIPSYKIGRRRMMSLQDVEAMIANARIEPKCIKKGGGRTT